MKNLPRTFEFAVHRVLITEEDEVIRSIDRDVCTHYLVPLAVMDEEIRPEIATLRLDVIQAWGGLEEARRLLARWYFSARREGWEEGEKEGDVINSVVDYFANTISGEWPSGWDLKTTLADIDWRLQ